MKIIPILRKNSISPVIISHIIFTIVSLYLIYYESTNFNEANHRGLFIPDVVNISDTFDSLYLIYRTSPMDLSNFGVSVLYGWTWLYGPWMCLIINNILIYLATQVFYEFIIKKLQVGSWLACALYINPYIVLAAVGPNKEIPLILLTSLWGAAMLSRSSFKIQMSFLIALLAYLFRDGFGLTLAILTLLRMYYGLASKYVPIIFFSICATAAASFGLIAARLSIFQRNLEILNEGFDKGRAVGALAASANLNPLNPPDGVLLYLIRIIYNSLVMGIFPSFQTEFRLPYYLGIAYWINGLMILYCLFSSIYLVTYLKTIKNRSATFIGISTIATLFFISTSLFVQPRYFIPILPFALSASFAISPPVRLRILGSALLICFSAIAFYSTFSDGAGILVGIDEIRPPSFLW